MYVYISEYTCICMYMHTEYIPIYIQQKHLHGLEMSNGTITDTKCEIKQNKNSLSKQSLQ